MKNISRVAVLFLASFQGSSLFALPVNTLRSGLCVASESTGRSAGAWEISIPNYGSAVIFSTKDLAKPPFNGASIDPQSFKFACNSDTVAVLAIQSDGTQLVVTKKFFGAWSVAFKTGDTFAGYNALAVPVKPNSTPVSLQLSDVGILLGGFDSQLVVIGQFLNGKTTSTRAFDITNGLNQQMFDFGTVQSNSLNGTCLVAGELLFGQSVGTLQQLFKVPVDEPVTTVLSVQGPARVLSCTSGGGYTFQAP